MAKKERQEVTFTQKRVVDFIPPTKGRTFVYDTRQACLRLQITHTGTKTYQFYSWVKGRGAVTITIGRIEKVSLADARRKTQSILGELAKDGAKAIDNLNKTNKEASFEELFTSWFNEKEAESGMTTSLANEKAKFTNHIKPTIGKKKVSTLTPEYLKKWHRGLINRNACNGDRKGKLSRTTANRCLETVSAVFNQTMIENPAKNIPHFKERSRDRYLRPDELTRFFRALEDPQTSESLKDIVLIALTTGARKANILSMRWSELDLTQNVWVIPAEKSKNGEVMYIPLIEEAVTIFQRRKSKASSVFVFPAKSKTGHVNTIFKRFKKLLESANIEDFRFHDLRRTCGSWQALSGNSILMIGKSLGHQSTESTKVYARIAENAPVRDSMATGFRAMVEASQENRILSIVGDE